MSPALLFRLPRITSRPGSYGMPSLPEPTGKYPVAAATFIRPIPREQQPVISNAQVHRDRHSSAPQGPLEPALKLEEVAFTVFYPADVQMGRSGWLGKHKGPAKGLDWFIHPIAESVRGYEHFSGNKSNSLPGGVAGMWLATAVRSLITWYGSTIKVPVYDCVPLLAPSGESDRWPLAIFSHGLCGSRTTYSTVCADLASHGRVVIAMEHRDGTGPAVFPAGRTVQYIAPNEVVWPDEQAGKQGSHKSAIQFRKAQLDFRRREIYETLHAVRSIAAGKHVESGLKVLEGEGFDFARWNGSLNQENVELVGHSFGGATILSLLSEPPPPMFQDERSYDRIPVRQSLLLDPWMEPMADPGPKPYSDGKEPTASDPSTGSQLLIIESENFTLWDSQHAGVLEAAAAFKPSRVLTLLRAEHTTFSDIAALTPRRFQSANGAALLQSVCRLSDAFLRREVAMDGPLEVTGVTTIDQMKVEEVEVKDKKKRRIIGEEGEVLVHS